MTVTGVVLELVCRLLGAGDACGRLRVRCFVSGSGEERSEVVGRLGSGNCLMRGSDLWVTWGMGVALGWTCGE